MHLRTAPDTGNFRAQRKNLTQRIVCDVNSDPGEAIVHVATTIKATGKKTKLLCTFLSLYCQHLVSTEMKPDF